MTDPTPASRDDWTPEQRMVTGDWRPAKNLMAGFLVLLGLALFGAGWGIAALIGWVAR